MAIGNYAAWSAEYTPPTLRAVGQAVVDRFAEIDWQHIGFKGDDSHFGGYHRSLRWCRVTRGKGVDYSDRIGRDTSQIGTRRQDAIRAFDVIAPAWILIPMCSRVDWAMRHGLLDDMREWYGNDNGDNRVDGYDNFFNIVVSSDDSHLWHLHGSLYTDTVEDPHDRLIAVLLGTPGWDSLEADMAVEICHDVTGDASSSRITQGPQGIAGQQRDTVWGWTWAEAQAATAAAQACQTSVEELREAVAELAARPAPGTVTVTDEQLERVLRRVMGSVDGASPAAS